MIDIKQMLILIDDINGLVQDCSNSSVLAIDLFHNNFSPCGKQPEHGKLAHEL